MANARGKAKTALETYYDLLAVQPRATAREVEIAFRRFIARYRPTIATTQLFTDPRFMKYVNAYLTLRGEQRAEHDALIHVPARSATVILPSPWATFEERQRVLFIARIALWRREHVEGIHLLRTLLEREPNWADGWALLGEFFLSIDRLEEGVRAYEHAVQADPQHTAYAARLRHARDALAGAVELEVEPSPEEEMLREERRQRRAMTAAIVGLGVITLLAALVPRGIHPVEGALWVPWRAVLTQALG